MIYDILEKKIADAGLAVPGQGLFRSFMPAEVTIGVMTRAPLTGIPIDPFITGWHRVRMQIITRHTDPVEGNKLASDVCKALIVEQLEIYPATTERGPAHITLFYPESLPVQFPRLEGNGLEFSQHFTAAFGFKPDWK